MARSETQLLENVLDMPGNRAFGDYQRLGDLAKYVLNVGNV